MTAYERIGLHPQSHVVVVKGCLKRIKCRKIPQKNLKFSHIFFTQLFVACLNVNFNERSFFSLSHPKFERNKFARLTRHFFRATTFAFFATKKNLLKVHLITLEATIYQGHFPRLLSELWKNFSWLTWKLYS